MAEFDGHFDINVNQVCPALTDRDPQVTIDLPFDRSAVLAVSTRVYEYCPLGEMEPHAEHEGFLTNVTDTRDPGALREIAIACEGCARLPEGFSVKQKMWARK